MASSTSFKSKAMLGGCGCLGLLALPCLIQMIGGGVVMLGGGGQPPNNNPQPSAKAAADASREAVQINKVQVQVAGASVEKANFGQQLRLKLRLTNKGGANVVYNGWGIAANGGFNPGGALALKDNLGNPYQMIQASGPVEGQVRQTTLEPGKSVEDVLLFQPPLPKIEFLELTLPGGNLGGGEPVVFRIPNAMLQRPDPKEP
jgi:hypothetical protein